jgi:hypothetical protein
MRFMARLAIFIGEFGSSLPWRRCVAGSGIDKAQLETPLSKLFVLAV